MPTEFRWFSSSCKSVNPTDGQILALDRPSLINQPPTPEPRPRVNQTNEPTTEVERTTRYHGSSVQGKRDEVKGDFQECSKNAQIATAEVVTSPRDSGVPQVSGVTTASAARPDTKETSADEESVIVVQSANAAAARRDPTKIEVNTAQRAPPQCRGGDDPPSQLARLATKEAETDVIDSNPNPSGLDHDKSAQSESQAETNNHAVPDVEDQVQMATAQQLVPNPLNSVDYKVDSAAADTTQTADLPSKDESNPVPPVCNESLVLETDGKPNDEEAQLEVKSELEEKVDSDLASSVPVKLASVGSRRTSSRRKRKAPS